MPSGEALLATAFGLLVGIPALVMYRFLLARADSLVLDPHKWLFQPYEIGCVLVRDFGHLSRSFHADASYIWLDDAVRQGVDFAMHGPDKEFLRQAVRFAIDRNA